MVNRTMHCCTPNTFTAIQGIDTCCFVSKKRRTHCGGTWSQPFPDCGNGSPTNTILGGIITTIDPVCNNGLCKEFCPGVQVQDAGCAPANEVGCVPSLGTVLVLSGPAGSEAVALGANGRTNNGSFFAPRDVIARRERARDSNNAHVCNTTVLQVVIVHLALLQER